MKQSPREERIGSNLIILSVVGISDTKALIQGKIKEEWGLVQ